MLLQELYNRPLFESFPYRLQTADEWKYAPEAYAEFKLPNGGIMKVEFESRDDPDDPVVITFRQKGGGAGQGYGATRENDHQHEIMATILKAVNEYISEYEPNKVTFSASLQEFNQYSGKHEYSNRGSLYAKFVNRLAKANGYTATVNVGDDDATFHLEKAKDDEETKKVKVPKKHELAKRTDVIDRNAFVDFVRNPSTETYAAMNPPTLERLQVALRQIEHGAPPSPEFRAIASEMDGDAMGWLSQFQDMNAEIPFY